VHLTLQVKQQTVSIPQEQVIFTKVEQAHLAERLAAGHTHGGPVVAVLGLTAKAVTVEKQVFSTPAAPGVQTEVATQQMEQPHHHTLLGMAATTDLGWEEELGYYMLVVLYLSTGIPEL